jgi:hypothetical protein
MGSRKIVSNQPEGFLPAVDRSIKLSVFEDRKNFFEAWSGGIAESLEVVTREEARGADLFGWRLCEEALDEIVGA